MTTTAAHFTPRTFTFLRQLARHNDRDWFKAHQESYEGDVKRPLLGFIADLSPRLGKVSRHFDADPRPVGGSMFRIHRDTRFAKDKSPYKTHAAAHFHHAACADGVHGPGFYLHLEPGACMGGGGLWHADAEALALVRDRIVARPREWQAVRATGIEIVGDSLKRAPAGYDPEHPFVEDLRRKDLYVVTSFSDRDVTSAAFLTRYVDSCRRAAPLVKFLSRALGLPF